jgi:transposase
MKDGVKTRYTLEFKRAAVRLAHSGEKVLAVAQTLGVSGQSLDNWVKAEAAGRLRDVRGKAVTAEQMEIARLKAELSRVRMERDILKKAAVVSTGHCNMTGFVMLKEASKWRARGGLAYRQSRNVTSGPMEGWAVPERYWPGSRQACSVGIWRLAGSWWDNADDAKAERGRPSSSGTRGDFSRTGCWLVVP